ncbi:MAG: restriction endonuclease subunit S [Oscillospiraceae bacterium]|nr:restriction endonuclease subunit S [Oscillospiraceae bacterium]
MFSTVAVKRKLSRSDISAYGKTPIFSAESDNNGIMGYTEQEPDYRVSEKTPLYLIFCDHTRNFCIADMDFCVADNVKILKSKVQLTKSQIMYITSAWKKCIENRGYSRHWKIAESVRFLLPTKNGGIDFDFMESFIAEMERRFVVEMEGRQEAEILAYLTVTGFEDTLLTEEEERALEKYKYLEWQGYRLGDLFDVKTPVKRFDANKVTVLEHGQHPYIVRLGTNNGQKGFLNESDKFLNDGNTISFGQDTATMYYQKVPYFTGDKIKILSPKFDGFSEKNAHFFLASMKRTFSEFAWGITQFNVGVLKEQIVELPVKDGEIDLAYMEVFVSAVKKLFVKDAIAQNNREIEATREIVTMLTQ